jgi:hypothetical protein
LIVCIIFLFLAVGFSGCQNIEELNHILVHVYAKAKVYVDYNPGINLLSDMTINLQILKDGAVMKDETLNTIDGYTPSSEATFKLYKEQDVVVRGWLRSNIPENYSDMSWVIYDYKTLTRDQVRSGAAYCESYMWHPTLDFFGQD